MIKENITRIIGIILLVIGILTFKELGGYSIAFFVPGLIMLIANKKIAQKELREFLLTFKSVPEKKFFLIALFDMFSWFGLFFFTYLVGSSMRKQLVFLQPGPDLLLKIMIMLIAYFVAMIFVSIIIYSIFKGLIWLTILKQKPTWSFFKKFSLFNFFWLLIWLVPAVLLAALRQGLFAYGVALIILTYVHFTSIAHYLFAKKHAMGYSIKNAFKIGAGKIRKFLLQYSYMVVVYLILLQVFWFVPKQMNYITFASLLMTVFFMAWYRLYLSRILHKLA